MNKLWLFFPENDIALAHGLANFTAPPAAVRLRRSGEILPLWMADKGDAVLCHGINDTWLMDVKHNFNIEADIWDRSDYDFSPTPWGWSAASRAMFLHEGFNADALLDNRTLENYRSLSHRRTASIITERVSDYISFDIYPPALEVSDTDTLSQILTHKGEAVIKAPWSSSGRGIRFVDNAHIENTIKSTAGTIRKQGSVMVEDFINPHFDFALLYFSENGNAEFKGFSLFATDTSNGQYSGNIVASQDELASRIKSRLVPDQLEAIIKALELSLADIVAPLYSGPVGIDMLADENGKMHIVELNLRYTMGFLALGLARHVESEAVFYIEKGFAEATKPVVDNGRLVKGTVALTPPGGDFTFLLKA